MVVEDEEVLRLNLCEFLSRAGYDVVGEADGEAALARVRNENIGIVVSDIQMPKMDGVTLLKHIVAERPDTRVVLTTAFASVDTALDALRHGAFDYLLKPIEFDSLLQKINNLASYQALRGEVMRLRRDLSRHLGFEGFVGQSEVMREVFELIEKVAPTNATTLITGESGTGKELVARAIWARSELADKEFVAVNMAALPDEMVESQLFGHERGAFTGAEHAREGLLRGIRGGTIFLDEIGELSLPAQAKLLRAVESGELLPLGASRPIKVRFRLIVATNRDLREAVSEGRFREDLYFRLNVFNVALPPLRDRREDIPPLVEHFIAHHGRKLGKTSGPITNEAMRRLLAYGWPGNVRELSNVIERAMILAGENQIVEENLPSQLLHESDGTVGLKAAVAAFERRHIEWVLAAHGGNREQAAKALEVDPATLYRRLSKYGIG